VQYEVPVRQTNPDGQQPALSVNSKAADGKADTLIAGREDGVAFDDNWRAFFSASWHSSGELRFHGADCVPVATM